MQYSALTLFTIDKKILTHARGQPQKNHICAGITFHHRMKDQLMEIRDRNLHLLEYGRILDFFGISISMTYAVMPEPPQCLADHLTLF